MQGQGDRTKKMGLECRGKEVGLRKWDSNCRGKEVGLRKWDSNCRGKEVWIKKKKIETEKKRC